MQPELSIILIIIFDSLFFFLLGIVVMWKITHEEKKENISYTASTSLPLPDAVTITTSREANINAEKLSKQEDIINHDGVGIVYRPDAEEITRMNEPKEVTEAKEAIAEVFENAEEPKI